MRPNDGFLGWFLTQRNQKFSLPRKNLCVKYTNEWPIDYKRQASLDLTGASKMNVSRETSGGPMGKIFSFFNQKGGVGKIWV